VLPEILPEVAVIIVVPFEVAVRARPLLLTVATEAFDEVQATCVVISWLVPSEYVPVAANCWVTCWLPSAVSTLIGMLGFAGVIAMEDRIAGFTVRVALPEILPEVAVMVAVPSATPLARPLLSIVATDGPNELQATFAALMTKLVPSV